MCRRGHAVGTVWTWVGLVGGPAWWQSRLRPRGRVPARPLLGGRLHPTPNNLGGDPAAKKAQGRRKFKTWTTEEAAEKHQSPTGAVDDLPVPQMGGFLRFGDICMQPTRIGALKGHLILALFFRFKTNVRIINSLKSFKMLAPSIRDLGECPGDYESRRGSISLPKAPRAPGLRALMFGRPWKAPVPWGLSGASLEGKPFG